MLRKIGVTLALALIVGGCGSNTPGSGDCKVVLTDPPDGKELRVWDGVAESDGLKITVRAITVGSACTAGTMVTLTVDGVLFGEKPATRPANAPDTAIPTVAFDGVTIPSGSAHVVQAYASAFPNLATTATYTFKPDPVGVPITLDKVGEVHEDLTVGLKVTVEGGSANCETLSICEDTDTECKTLVAPFAPSFLPATNPPEATFSVTLPNRLDECRRFPSAIDLRAVCTVGKDQRKSNALALTPDFAKPEFDAWTWDDGTGATALDGTAAVPTLSTSSGNRSVKVSTKCAAHKTKVNVLIDGNGTTAFCTPEVVSTDGGKTGIATCSSVTLPQDGAAHSLEASYIDFPRIAHSKKVWFVAGCTIKLDEPKSGATKILNTDNCLPEANPEGCTSGTYTIVGKTGKDCAAAGEVQVYLENGVLLAKVRANANGVFGVPFTTNNGDDHTATVVIGKVGQTVTNPAGPSFHYRADFAPPTLSFVNAPAATQVINGWPLDLEIQVDDPAPGAPLTGLPVKIFEDVSNNFPFIGNPLWGVLDATGSTALSVLLSEGQQTLTVIATDAAGNEVSKSLTVLVDRTGCLISFTPHVNGTVTDPALALPPAMNYFNRTNYRSTAVAGSTTDRQVWVTGTTMIGCVGGRLDVTKKIGASEVPVGSANIVPDGMYGTFDVPITLTHADRGTLVFQITAAGHTSKPGAPPPNFAADFAAPTITALTVTAPAANAAGPDIYDVRDLTIAVSTTGVEDLQRVQLPSCDPGTVLNGSATLNCRNLPTGSQTLTASVTDLAGNAATFSKTVVIDPVGCDVTLTASTSRQLYGLGNTTASTGSTRTVTLSGSTTQCKTQSLHPKAIAYKVVGTTRTPSAAAAVDASGAFSVTVSLSDNEDGQIIVQVYSDQNAMLNGSVRDFSADFTRPTITWAAPPNPITSLVTTIPFTVTDAGRSVDQVVVIVTSNGNEIGRGTTNSSGLANVTVQFPSFAQAVPISVTTADKVGNASNAFAQTVNVDRDGCDDAVLAAHPTVFNTVNSTVSQVSGQTKGTYVFTGTTTKCAGGTIAFTSAHSTSVPTTIAANGQFSVSVVFDDGITATDTMTVSLTKTGFAAVQAIGPFGYKTDFTPPRLTLTAPTSTTIITSATYNFVVSVSGAEVGQPIDIYSGTQKIGTGYVQTAGTSTVTIPNSVPLTAGTWNFSATVSDAAGNTVSPLPSVPNVEVDLTGCDPTISTAIASVYNLANTTATANAAQRTITISGTVASPKCDGGTVTVMRGSNNAGTTTVATGGTFSVVATLVDGDTSMPLTLTVVKDTRPAPIKALGAYTADFTAPTLSFANLSSTTVITATSYDFILNVGGVEAGRSVDLYLGVYPNTGAVKIGTALVTAGSNTVTIRNTVALTAGTATYSAIVSDLAGNPVSPVPQVANVEVDLTGCDPAISTTIASTYNIATTTATGTASQRTITISGTVTSPRCDGGTVTVYRNGVSAGTATVATGGAFSVPATLVDGDTNAQLKLNIVKGNRLAPMKTLGSYSADFTAPTLSFSGLTSTTIITAANYDFVVNVSGAEVGRAVDLYLGVFGQTGAQKIGTANVITAGSSTLTIRNTVALTAGTYTFSATVSDLAGNAVTPPPQVSGVEVDLTGCDPTITTTFVSTYYTGNTTATADPTQRLLTIIGNVASPKCDGATVTVTRTVGTNTNTAGTSTVATGGAINVTALLVDGDTNAQLKLTVTKAGRLAPVKTLCTYSADFTPPTVVWATSTPSTSNPLIASASTPIVISVTGADGQQLKLTSSVSGDVGTCNVSGTTCTIASPILPTAGPQTLTASVKDAAGNDVATSPSPSLAVLYDPSGCQVTITSPASIISNIANVTKQVTITGKTSTSYCIPGSGVTATAFFYREVGAASPVAAGSAALDSSGNFSGPANFPTEEFGNLRVQIVRSPAGSLGTGATISFVADYTAPTISASSAVPSLTGSFQIVYAGHPNAGQAGYVTDSDSGTPGGQFDWTLPVSGAGSISGTGSGSVTVSRGGTAVCTPITVANNGNQNVSGGLACRISVPEGFSGTVDITVADAANNQTTSSWQISGVATIGPPATITLTSPTGSVNILTDFYHGANGTTAQVQGTVSYSSTPPAGSQVYLCSTVQIGSASQCKVGSVGGQTFYELPYPGDRMSASNTTFTGLTLPVGNQKVLAELTTSTGAWVASAPVDLNVDLTAPKLNTLSAPADVNVDGTITSSELLAGAPVVLNATFTGVENNQKAYLYEGSSQLTWAFVNNNQATFSLTTVLDGHHNFHVEVADAASNPNQVLDAVPYAYTNPEAYLGLEIHRVPPTIAFVSPVATCTKALDQTVIVGNDDCDLDYTVQVTGTPVQVAFNGAGTATPASTSTFVGGRATTTYHLPQGSNLISATITDLWNNTATTTFTVFVDTIAPIVQIASPATNTVFSGTTIPVLVYTDAEVGRHVTVYSNGSVVGEGDCVAGGPLGSQVTINASVNGSPINQTLIARVSDVVGNLSVDTAASMTDIVLNLSGCDVNFTQPTASNLILNASSTTTNSLQFVGYTSAPGCANATVDFAQSVDGGAFTAITSVTASGGAFSYTHAFANGTRTVFRASITYGGVTNSKSVTVTTDITPPVLTITSPTPAAGNVLYVVAQTGNIHVGILPGFIADASGQPGGQVDFEITCNGCGDVVNGGQGSLTILEGANPVSTTQIGNNGLVSFTGASAIRVTLDQGYAGALTISAKDAANNVVSQTWTVTVDVIAPDAPTSVTTDPGNGIYTRVIDERHADFNAVFVPSVDSGPAGATLSWEFGYSSRRVLGGATFDESAYANVLLTTMVNISDPAVANTAYAVPVRAVDPFNTYVFAARVIDSVGNRSPLVEHSLDTNWSLSTTNYPGSTPTTTSAFFGSPLAAGDVNGDGIVDLAVASGGDTDGQGAAFIYYGGASGFASTQKILGPAGQMFFAYPMTLVDLNGDGRSDLVAYSGNGISVYFATNANPALPTTSSFDIVGDWDIYLIAPAGDINGDGIADLAMTNYLQSTVYIFFGRSDAAWGTKIVAGTVDITSADVIITGAPTASLGAGYGLAAVPDLNSDGKGELLVGASGANTAYLFSGSTLVACGAGCTPGNASRTFSVAAGVAFGQSVLPIDADADGRLDVAVGEGSGGNSVFIFKNTGGLAFSATPDYTYHGTANFGWNLATGDLNRDGRPDLVIGANSSSPETVGIVWSTTGGLKAAVGSTLAGGPAFGEYVLVAPYLGSAAPDLVIGDFVNGNGSFHIYY